MKTNPELLAIIDRARCEAKGPCVEACPTHAITLGPVDAETRAGLSLLARIKLWVHGGQQAWVDPAACLGCAACVPVCPERAIKLQRRVGADLGAS
jgi:NAD-dependent dihydropyrimidine dehydrogenase PreA subunit